MTQIRNRPAADRAALEVLADYSNTAIVQVPSDGGHRIQYVIEMSVAGLWPEQARKTVLSHTQNAKPGTYVRLRVDHRPPSWFLAYMRGDLVWQIIAPDATTLNYWQDYIEGNR